jgi:hypothetical protein
MYILSCFLWRISFAYTVFFFLHEVFYTTYCTYEISSGFLYKLSYPCICFPNHFSPSAVRTKSMPWRLQVKPCDQISGGQEEVLCGRAGMLFVHLHGLIIIVCALNVRDSTLINAGLLHLNCSSDHIALAYQKMINGSCRLMYKNGGI